MWAAGAGGKGQSPQGSKKAGRGKAERSGARQDPNREALTLPGAGLWPLSCMEIRGTAPWVSSENCEFWKVVAREGLEPSTSRL